MADQITELDLVKAKVMLSQIADDMFTAAETIDRLMHALEMIIEVPNNSASHSRALSEIVKIATQALEGQSAVAH
jgi:hypothetical protein